MPDYGVAGDGLNEKLVQHRQWAVGITVSTVRSGLVGSSGSCSKTVEPRSCHASLSQDLDQRSLVDDRPAGDVVYLPPHLCRLAPRH